MKKFIRLLLSFLSVLLFFSCSNNLKSSSLVISFNLQNQKNQNVQRTAANQENLNVTVTLYDVLTTENNLQNLADFKIIETQTVPIVNNKALVQIDNVQIGTNALITAQITQNNQTLYEGKSEIFTVSEGKNQVKIQLKKVSSSEPENPENSDDPNKNPDSDTNDENIPEDDIPPEETQDPDDQKNTISVAVQIPNSDVSFNINVTKIQSEDGKKIKINIPSGSYQIDKVIVDGNLLEPIDSVCTYSDFAAEDILFITVVIKDGNGNCYSKSIQYDVENNRIVGE